MTIAHTATPAATGKPGRPEPSNFFLNPIKRPRPQSQLPPAEPDHEPECQFGAITFFADDGLPFTAEWHCVLHDAH